MCLVKVSQQTDMLIEALLHLLFLLRYGFLLQGGQVLQSALHAF